MLCAVFLDADRSLAEQASDTTTVAVEPSETLPEFPKLRESVETALRAENKNIAQLENQLSELKNLDKTISEEVNAYKIQLSNYKNILVSPTALVEDIERLFDAVPDLAGSPVELPELLLEPRDHFIMVAHTGARDHCLEGSDEIDQWLERARAGIISG